MAVKDVVSTVTLDHVKELIAAAVPLPSPKPGIKTSEFWVTVLTSIGALAGALTGVLPPRAAAASMTVSSIAYGICRTLIKR